MEYLFDRYSVGIYHYISLRVGRNQALADELVQQLWLQACKSGRGGRHILSAEGFAEIAGEHEIGEDDRQILDKLRIQMAYTRDDGVQWATVDIPDLVNLKVELANPEIDPALFNSERYENDGVTQVFDMAGLMNMFGPQSNTRSRRDGS